MWCFHAGRAADGGGIGGGVGRADGWVWVLVVMLLELLTVVVLVSVVGWLHKIEECNGLRNKLSKSFVVSDSLSNEHLPFVCNHVPAREMGSGREGMGISHDFVLFPASEPPVNERMELQSPHPLKF